MLRSTLGGAATTWTFGASETCGDGLAATWGDGGSILHISTVIDRFSLQRDLWLSRLLRHLIMLSAALLLVDVQT